MQMWTNPTPWITFNHLSSLILLNYSVVLNISKLCRKVLGNFKQVNEVLFCIIIDSMLLFYYTPNDIKYSLLTPSSFSANFNFHNVVLIWHEGGLSGCILTCTTQSCFLLLKGSRTLNTYLLRSNSN